MKKRLLSVTAILALCLALLSVTALAEDAVDYGVTVNGTQVTSANADDVLGDSKVSYDADANTLTINGTLSGSGSGENNIIGNGTTDVKIDGGSGPAVVGSSFTVTGARDVTVTANSGGSAILGSTNISCTGNVSITNSTGSAVSDRLTVNGAKNVTVTANANYRSPAISGDTAITCSGNVEITNQGINNAGAAVAGSLTVTGAQNVTVTANSYNAAISTRATIACSGNVEITNTNQDGYYAVRELTVTGAQNVTVTANSITAAIDDNSSTGVGANITCSGDVSITNSGSGMAVDGTLTVDGAQNVKVTANSSNNSAIYSNAAITCSGDVEITNSAGMAVYGQLTVLSAQDVTVTANSGGPAIGSFFAEFGADITCSGDVEITNSAGTAVGYTLFVRSAQNVKVTVNGNGFAINNGAKIACSGNVEITNNGPGGAVIGSLTVNRAQDVTVTANDNQAVSQTLTVKDAQNVTVTTNSSLAATINDVDITCSGNVEIVNEGGGKAVGFTLTFQQSNGHSYTVKTGSSLETLKDYMEKAERETFEVESLEASAVKIESADHTPGEWKYNSTQHWRLCTVCGEALDQEDHTFSGSTCTVCGYTKPSSGGSYTPTYSITVPKTEHGSVTVSPGYAERGDTVTVAVKPDKGYTLETLTVTDKNGNEIELTSKGDGKYTFKMPGSKVTVKATFMEDNTMLNFFVDVPADAYYYDAVLWAAENGITGGVDDTHFAPNATCTRAQIATFLWRAAGCPEPETVSSFADVPADSYYAKAVAWAVENGITTGTGDGMFSPNATCTRAQIVTFLWRNQKSPVAGTANPFTDVTAGAYYTGAVLWAAENGITSGTSATTFSPNANCTRAQIVTFLFRCLGGE